MTKTNVYYVEFYESELFFVDKFATGLTRAEVFTDARRRLWGPESNVISVRRSAISKEEPADDAVLGTAKS
jgi:hypothetical protein